MAKNDTFHWGSVRMKLDAILKSICDNVYFQAPTNTKMSYPCIRYELNDMDINRANDKPYLIHDDYRVDVISKDPNCPLRMQVANIPFARFDRFYASNGLNHWVFTINQP